MKISSLMLFLLVAGMLIALPVYAAEQMDQHQRMNTQGDMRSSQHSSQMMSFKANDLIGKTVKDRNNNSLGKVEDIVISQDGRADFVILAESGKIGTTEKYVPIPFQTLMSSNNISNTDMDKDLVANFDKTKLDSAPGFKDKKFDLSKSDWQCRTYSFYGVNAPHGC